MPVSRKTSLEHNPTESDEEDDHCMETRNKAGKRKLLFFSDSSSDNSEDFTPSKKIKNIRERKRNAKHQKSRKIKADINRQRRITALTLDKLEGTSQQIIKRKREIKDKMEKKDKKIKEEIRRILKKGDNSKLESCSLIQQLPYKITTINCGNTFPDKWRSGVFTDWMTMNDCDMLIVAEASYNYALNYERVGFNLIQQLDRNGSKGVAIIVTEPLYSEIKEYEGKKMIEGDSNRISIQFQNGIFDSNGLNTWVNGIYAPDQAKTKKREIFWSSTKEVVQDMLNSSIIIGDFNIRQEAIDSNSGKTTIHPIFQNIKDLGFTDIWRTQHPNVEEYTYIREINWIKNQF